MSDSHIISLPDDQESLLSDNNNEFNIGTSWVIDNKGRSPGARLFTGRLQFFCCFSMGMEIFNIPDNTVVQIDKLLPSGSGVVQVVVVSCPINRNLENEVGTVQIRWLWAIKTNNNSKFKKYAEDPQAQFRNLPNKFDNRRGNSRSNRPSQQPRSSNDKDYDQVSDVSSVYSVGAESVAYSQHSTHSSNSSNSRKSQLSTASGRVTSLGKPDLLQKESKRLKSSRAGMITEVIKENDVLSITSTPFSTSALSVSNAQFEADTRRVIEESRKKIEASKAVLPELDEMDEASSRNNVKVRLEFPVGNLNCSDLVQFAAVIKYHKLSYSQIFSMLADGKVRAITGDVLKEGIRKLQMISNLENVGSNNIPTLAAQVISLFELFPLDNLIEIKIVDREVIIYFDFLGQDKLKLKIPGMDRVVVVSENEKDPFLQCPENGLKKLTSEAAKYYLSNEIHLTLGDNGIESIRDGDIVQRGLIDINTSVRMENIKHRADLDSKGRHVLWVLNSGRPVTKYGKYCPRYSDNWLVFSNIRGENWIMLPELY